MALTGSLSFSPHVSSFFRRGLGNSLGSRISSKIFRMRSFKLGVQKTGCTLENLLPSHHEAYSRKNILENIEGTTCMKVYIRKHGCDKTDKSFLEHVGLQY